MRKVKSKPVADFYCLTFFHLFRTKKNLNLRISCVKMKTFVLLRCLMKILEPNQYQKSDNAPSIICADFEYLIKTKWINVKIILKNHLQQK